ARGQVPGDLGPGLALPAGDVIRTIRVEGNQRIEAETVRSYLAIEVGDPFDPARLDQSLKNLFATGLFDDVALSREGDALVVRVVENPIINRIVFEGNRRVDDETLSAELQLRPRVVYTRSRVQNAVARILEIYRRNGRYAATVQPQVIELEQNRVDLVFEINEGPVTRVQRIIFLGNRAFSDATLRGQIQTTESRWYRLFTSDDTYDPDRLAFDQELLRRFYLSRGYADFNVLSAIAELTPDGERFFITFTVEEGPRYDFGEVRVDSRLRDVAPQALAQQVTTRRGEVYNANQVEDSIVALTERLGELGYAFVEVEPRLEKNRDARTVDLTYVINEGPRVYVERIDIVGNVRTLDEVIRREFRLAEGDPFNTALLRRSRQRIQNLGYFETVEMQTLPGSIPDRTAIEVQVAERSTGELSFGAGYSPSEGLLADVRIRERNLLGRGQDLRAGATVSGRTQQIDLSFTEPYFLDRDLAAGFDLFRRTTDFQDESSFDRTRTGGTLRASYPLTEQLRHSLRYTLRYDEIEDVDDDASIFIQQEEGDALTSLIGHTLTYDTRDNQFLPSEGYLLRVSQDLAGLGGDSQFLRHEVTASYYYPLFPDVVFNLAVDAGNVFGYAGDDVTLFERFFVGGNNFRGFRFAGIGPRDVTTDDALGGNSFAIGTAEVRFPLGLPEELRVFGRAFLDAGTLTGIDVDDPGGIVDDSGDLRAAGGFGLSWLSPFGPIAIDIAFPFLKDDEDETENFRLSFGTRF
ncbi:MAG TPA: outer membrane protein assembly factor BamA, partial [Candidatus Limnocylindrales bacterium]|nr:outer membrane protein assembly factor BamA [Candidatus Limnocylindrales bacterium]